MTDDYLQNILGPGGRLAAHLPGYEPRPRQLELARAVDFAFADGRNLLAEGPCGIGKSVAYLVPAVHHALRGGGQVVVATANIALQEQLIQKDLPMLQRALAPEENFTYRLMKGKANYLCQARHIVYEDSAAPAYLKGAARDQWDEIRVWAEGTKTGDVNELPFKPDPRIWAAICGHRDECVPKECKETECLAYKARQEAREGNIIVCNYHVLFSHIQVRLATGKDVILPRFKLLICDEGHEMANIARDFLGFRVTEFAMRSLVAPLEERGEADLAVTLAGLVVSFWRDVRDKINKLQRTRSSYIRIREQNFVNTQRLLMALADALNYWAELETDLEANEDTSKKERSKVRRWKARTSNVLARIMNTTELKGEADYVYYITEDDKNRIEICGKPVDVSKGLRAGLFDETDSTIITSATMTTGSDFNFMRHELGLRGEEAAMDVAVPTPFDFGRQMLIVVPRMKYGPEEQAFVGELGTSVEDVVRRMSGRTLALFTSHKRLKATYDHLAGRDLPFTLLRQGTAPRTQLLQRFRDEVNSVLLGTASFWTGVDIPGEALSCLTIDRLPFPVPDDPVLEVLKERDPQGFFRRHVMPRAVLTLRQGVGRLIRNTADRGIVVIFDRRVWEKSYGKAFMYSLPQGRKTRDLGEIETFMGAGVTNG